MAGQDGVDTGLRSQEGICKEKKDEQTTKTWRSLEIKHGGDVIWAPDYLRLDSQKDNMGGK